MKKQSINITQLLFLMPILVAFSLVILIPFLLGIYYSFTDWSKAGVDLTFVGLENYKSMFGDKQFYYSTIWTITYTLLNVVVVNVLAITFAIFVTQKLKLKNVYRAGFFLPNLIGGIVLGTIWSFIFNKAFTQFGATFDIELLSSSWLESTTMSKAALVMVGSWQYIGYIMMIYIAALQNVPADLIEAANIDGANVMQRIRHITIPMIIPAFTISMFLTLVNAFKQYDINFALTKGGPSQIIDGEIMQSTQMLAMSIVKTSQNSSIDNFKAVGQAQAVVFFLFLVTIALFQVALTKKKEVEM